MKSVKFLLMVFCLVICLASPSYSLDPYKTHRGGFGPRVAGAQLGVKMSLRDVIRWRANLRGVPFTIEINSEKIPGKKPSEAGSISILFTGKGKELTGYKITDASRGFYRLRNENMKLLDLIAEIEKARVEIITLRGTNTRVKEDCISFTNDFRVASVRIRRSDFEAENIPHESFVRELTENYDLPEMRRRGNTWSFRDDSNGWQITYHGLGDGIFEITPVIQ